MGCDWYYWLPPFKLVCRWDAFQARVILAALDHNLHLKRKTLSRQDGSTRYHRKWSPRSKRWYVSERKEEKDYKYHAALMARLFMFYLTEGQAVRRKVILGQDHPESITRTIANVQPEATDSIAVAQVSRRQQQPTQVCLNKVPWYSILTYSVPFPLACSFVTYNTVKILAPLLLVMVCKEHFSFDFICDSGVTRWRWRLLDLNIVVSRYSNIFFFNLAFFNSDII